VTTAATKAYPIVRNDRGDPVTTNTQQSALSGAGQAPRGRLWPFDIRQASGVAVIVSDIFNGPAIIDSFWLQIVTTFANPFPTWTIYKGTDNGGAGTSLAAAFEPSGIRLMDNTTYRRDDATPISDLRGMPINTTNAAVGYPYIKLGIPVTDPTFYVKIRLNCQNANGLDIIGLLRVIENVSPQALANFL
jgi:hypothetical protein